MNKRTKKLQFDKETKEKIAERDRQCIFCRMGYHTEGAIGLDCMIYDIMHYIPKSQGGLGIEQNGVLGCRYHHMMLDNGSRGLRPEMLQIMKDHLTRMYPYWDESSLYFRKMEEKENR